MSTDVIGNGRPQRGCSACGQVDDHPRHGFGRSAATEAHRYVNDDIVMAAVSAADDADKSRIALEMSGVRGLSYHIDCCRALGCEQCSEQPDLRGGELLEHIRKGA